MSEAHSVDRIGRILTTMRINGEAVEGMGVSPNKKALSDNHCAAPSEEVVPPTETHDNDCCRDENDEQSVLCHDLWRIALYYIYTELTPSQVEKHVDVQSRVCEELGLKGRIRISHEGVNGVLSGEYETLRVYEKRISRALQEAKRDREIEKGPVQELSTITDVADANDDEQEDGDETINLDVKYCELRAELPIQRQLFDRLMVKETKNVIGLFDQSFGQRRQKQQQEKLSKSEKYRRRRERKRQEQEEKRRIKIEESQQSESPRKQYILPAEPINPTDNEKPVENDGEEAETKKNAQSPSQPPNMSSLYQSVMEKPLKPAKHLSATEWNNELDAVASSGKSALLLDVRNVYEMKVGHFAHPSAPTLLPNTRKYSDLPPMLASSKAMQDRDQIFMYCTGGVRCERVSMLVRELYPKKEIFQLQGGIQRYIETCSEQKQQREEDGGGKDDGNSYFVGKNFVSFILLAPNSILKESPKLLLRRSMTI